MSGLILLHAIETKGFEDCFLIAGQYHLSSTSNPYIVLLHRHPLVGFHHFGHETKVVIRFPLLAI